MAISGTGKTFLHIDVMLRGEQVSYQIKGDTVFIGE